MQSDLNGHDPLQEALAKFERLSMARSAEFERLRTTAHVPPQWDGMLTLENEVFINGIRYDPGTYRTSLAKLNGEPEDVQF